jgi:pimeloyl-ACP methyl ester carboxylesterase
MFCGGSTRLRGPEHWRTLLPQLQRIWAAPAIDAAADLARVAALTLVVGGDRDELHTVEETVDLFRTLPSAELCVLPGVGHDRPRHPEAFVVVVEDFLARRAPA